jgi:hypothetical protein
MYNDITLNSDIVYLSAVISSDQTPEDVLSPYLNVVLNIHQEKGESITVVFSLFYAHPLPLSLAPGLSAEPPNGIIPVRLPSVQLPELGDSAAEEAKQVF